MCARRRKRELIFFLFQSIPLALLLSFSFPFFSLLFSFLKERKKQTTLYTDHLSTRSNVHIGKLKRPFLFGLVSCRTRRGRRRERASLSSFSNKAKSRDVVKISSGRTVKGTGKLKAVIALEQVERNLLRGTGDVFQDFDP